LGLGITHIQGGREKKPYTFRTHRGKNAKNRGNEGYRPNKTGTKMSQNEGRQWEKGRFKKSKKWRQNCNLQEGKKVTSVMRGKVQLQGKMVH